MSEEFKIELSNEFCQLFSVHEKFKVICWSSIEKVKHFNCLCLPKNN